MKRKVFLLYAETQIHAGAGTDVGIVDLPIQRERTTDFPIIQGMKGALRANIKDSELEGKEEDIKGEDIFGSKPSEEGTSPGKITFSEAKILLFPVRNPCELFVWVTCPLALIRFFKNFDKAETWIERVEKLNLSDSTAIVGTDQADQGYICLEEIRLSAQKDCLPLKLGEKIAKCLEITNYMRNKLKKDIVIVSDKMFSRIVKTMTEVIPRVRISEKGVVETGALWYEEYLPQDTIMYFVARETVYAKGEELDLLEKVLKGRVISVGGKETVGKGLMTVGVINCDWGCEESG